MSAPFRLSSPQLSYIVALVRHRKGIEAVDLAWTFRVIWDIRITGNCIYQVVYSLKRKREEGKRNYYDVYWSAPLPNHGKVHLEIYSILFDSALAQTKSDQSLQARRRRDQPNRTPPSTEFYNRAIRNYTIIEQMDRAGILNNNDQTGLYTIEEPEDDDDEDAPTPPRHAAPTRRRGIVWREEEDAPTPPRHPALTRRGRIQ
ncbi:MAG: hypothetical protein Q9196_004566 [Gyalolechia fulgens]